MRMIVDLNDLRQSVTVNTLGQSGHAYHPHYNDMADLWRNIRYHRMLWAQEDVLADSQGHLQLIP
jgi:penicillin amidase